MANKLESIEIFPGENGGHRVVHNFKREPGKKQGAAEAVKREACAVNLFKNFVHNSLGAPGEDSRLTGESRGFGTEVPGSQRCSH